MSTAIHSGRALRRCSLVVAVLAGVTACGGGGEQPGESAAPTANATADGPGVVKGRILFEGTPPPRQPVRMASDPKCAEGGTGALSETVVVGPDGGLQNVFVHVKEGLGDRVYPTPAEPVMLDQVGCRYTPHVFGVQVGQPIHIMNSDATLHNVHAIPKENREFNFGQATKGMQSTRTFDKPEVMVPFRCDVHGWMNAYAGVTTHPFHAVTNEDGTFEIKGLPPGTFTIEVWHEKLGTQTQEVTIAEGAPEASLDFSYQQT